MEFMISLIFLVQLPTKYLVISGDSPSVPDAFLFFINLEACNISSVEIGGTSPNYVF